MGLGEKLGRWFGSLGRSGEVPTNGASPPSATAIVDATLLEAADATVGDAGATVAGGLRIPVVPDGEAARADSFMCSKCRKVLPLAEMTILPAYSERFGRWVSAYRCRDDFARTIDDARATVARTRPADEDSLVDFAGSFLELVCKDGANRDRVKARTSGMEAMAALHAALDLLAEGAVRLSLAGEPSPPAESYDDGTPDELEALFQRVASDLFEHHGFSSPIDVIFRSPRDPAVVVLRRYVIDVDTMTETRGRVDRGDGPAHDEYWFRDPDGGFATLSLEAGGEARIKVSK